MSAPPSCASSGSPTRRVTIVPDFETGRGWLGTPRRIWTVRSGRGAQRAAADFPQRRSGALTRWRHCSLTRRSRSTSSPCVRCAPRLHIRELDLAAPVSVDATSLRGGPTASLRMTSATSAASTVAVPGRAVPADGCLREIRPNHYQGGNNPVEGARRTGHAGRPTCRRSGSAASSLGHAGHLRPVGSRSLLSAGQATPASIRRRQSPPGRRSRPELLRLAVLVAPTSRRRSAGRWWPRPEAVVAPRARRGARTPAAGPSAAAGVGERARDDDRLAGQRRSAATLGGRSSSRTSRSTPSSAAGPARRARWRG